MLKNLAYLAAFTTFVVLVWIMLSIYSSITSSTLSKAETIQVVPLSPTFNTKVIDSLQTRINVPVNLSEKIATASSQAVQTSNTTTIASETTSTASPRLIPSPTGLPTPIISQPPGETISNISPAPNL